MAKEKTIKKEKARVRAGIKARGSRTVTVWNDDFTTTGFVVTVPGHVFLKAEAARIMPGADRNGQCIVGRYCHVIAAPAHAACHAAGAQCRLSAEGYVRGGLTIINRRI